MHCEGNSQCATHGDFLRNIFWDNQIHLKLGGNKAGEVNDNHVVAANLFGEHECYDCSGSNESASIEFRNTVDKAAIILNTFTDCQAASDVHQLEELDQLDAEVACNVITNCGSGGIRFDGETLGSGNNRAWAYYDTPTDTPEDDSSQNVTASDGLDAGDFAPLSITYWNGTEYATKTFDYFYMKDSAPDDAQECPGSIPFGYGDNV